MKLVNRNWLSGGENLPEILLGYPQYHGRTNEHSYRNLLWRMDKICPSDKPHCTVASGAGGLYRNPMLCERLARRTGILLKEKGQLLLLTVPSLLMNKNFSSESNQDVHFIFHKLVASWQM